MAVVTIRFTRGGGDRQHDPVIAPMLGDSLPAIQARGSAVIDELFCQLPVRSIDGPYTPDLMVQPCGVYSLVALDGTTVIGRITRIEAGIDFRSGTPTASIKHRIEICQ